MDYTLQRDEQVSGGIKRIVDGKVEAGLEHIDGDMDRHETVHEEELFTPATRETLERVIMDRRSQLQRRGRPIGERLFAESPDTLLARMRQYWTATREYETA